MTPVVLRIKLRYDDVDVMVQRFAPNVGKSGLFLPTRSIQPIGTELKFELRLSNDQPVLVGQGRVKHARDPDPEQPRAVYGLGVELMRVTREGRDLILRMIERRRALGVRVPGVPAPEDVEDARRALDDEAAVPQPMPVVESHADVLLTAPRAIHAIPSAPLHVVLPLSAEPPRRRRPPVGEIIERASGPVAALAIPGLEDDGEVDVAAAIARARLLATGDLDGELEALRDQSAAPLAEIAIDAASAELARQLGGAAVRRDRSQRAWAPLPPVAEGSIAEGSIVDASTAQSSSAEVSGASSSRGDEAAPVEAAPVEAAPGDDLSAPIAEPEEPPPAPTQLMPTFPDEDDVDVGFIERDADDAGHLARSIGAPEPADSAEIHQVDEAQIDDEIHQLSEGDFEDVEHTQIGATPYETDPALAARLDAHLSAAERDDLGLGVPTDKGPFHNYERAPSAPDPDELEPSLDGAEEIPDDAEEVEEFEILAEAEADPDAALGGDLGSDPDSLPPVRPSLSDFASRLDLGDDSDLYPSAPEPGYYERRRNLSDELPSPRELDLRPDPRSLSAGHALAQFEDDSLTPDPRDSGSFPQRDSEDSFTHADDFDAPHAGFSAPHAFDQSDVIAIPPELVEPPRLRPQPPPPEDYDLETALEALDVDLDDISMPHASTELHREGAPANRIAGRPTIRPPGDEPSQRSPRAPTRRAQTEDGVLIDFDDDDE